jgi:hypothetical protein
VPITTAAGRVSTLDQLAATPKTKSGCKSIKSARTRCA